jgi:Pectinacetylesterase
MRAVLLLATVLALSPLGADASRQRHHRHVLQSDESGETGDVGPGASTSAGQGPPPFPQTPPYPTMAPVSATELKLRMLKDYPQALCNDGTHGGYYWSQGTDPNLWVVYLQGGYWCIDRLTCHGRMSDVDQASSKFWQPSTLASGIFSREANNSFSEANMVYVRYCSSDAWMGNVVAWDEYFYGAPTVYAVFEDLMANMGLASGAQVLFGGCSAGARGALVHLDNIASWMSTYGIEVRGLLDSGLWIDYVPLTNGGMGGTLVNQAEYVYGFANVSSVIPEDCAQAYQGEEWKCIFPQYRMPFVKTSYFVSASSFDDFQTNYDCDASPIQDTQIMQNAPFINSRKTIICFNNFQTAMNQVLVTLPTMAQTTSAVFSSACSLHCTSTGADYWSITVNGQTFSTLMAAWWFGHDTPRTISTCQGTPCMAKCIPEEQRFPQGFGATENIARR